MVWVHIVCFMAIYKYIRRRVEQTTKFVTGNLSDNSDMNTLFFDEGHTIFSMIECFRHQNF